MANKKEIKETNVFDKALDYWNSFKKLIISIIIGIGIIVTTLTMVLNQIEEELPEEDGIEQEDEDPQYLNEYYEPMKKG